MTDDYAGGAATRAMGLVAAMRPLLANKGPDVQSAALAELVATWVAGHHPGLRSDVVALWMNVMLDLVPICEAEMFRGKPRPEGWGP